LQALTLCLIAIYKVRQTSFSFSELFCDPKKSETEQKLSVENESQWSNNFIKLFHNFLAPKAS
jgi:hypothetical protein